MKQTSTIATVVLAAACLFSSSSAHALTKKQMVVLGTVLGCGYLLFQREPVKNFTPRYSLETVKDVEHILTREYLDNLWYLFYDGFIGQTSKKKDLAHGVLGTTAYYLNPLKKASGFVAFAYMFYRIGTDIEKHIEKLTKHKD